MPIEKPKFCLSRAEAAHFEPLHRYRDGLKIRDLGLCAQPMVLIDA